MFKIFKKLIKKKRKNKIENCNYITIDIDKASVKNTDNNVLSKDIKDSNNTEDINNKTEISSINNANNINDINDNIIDFSKYRKEKESKKIDLKKSAESKNIALIKEEDYLDITNLKQIKELLKGEKCIECKDSLDSAKISAVSSSKTYRYICCSNCGCIMKVDQNWNISNSRNILKEVSDAYKLFKEVNINPRSYSYTRNGTKHNF